jgi:hypothetical protein
MRSFGRVASGEENEIVALRQFLDNKLGNIATGSSDEDLHTVTFGG